MSGRRGRRWWAAAPWILAGLALTLVPWPSTWVEIAFGHGLIEGSSRLLAATVGRVPWSVSGALIAATVVTLAVGSATRAGRRRVAAAVPPALAALLLSFPLVWGLGYHRDTLATLADLPAGPPTEAERSAVGDALLGTVAATAGAPVPADAVAAASACVVREVRRLTGATVALPPRVKALPSGSLLALGFAGVTSPWLLEPHVDAGLPAAARLATATHELVHAAGFAREADTDALAVIAGVRCDDGAVRYALALHALEGLMAGSTPERRAAWLRALPERARRDLAAEAEAAARYRLGWASRWAGRAYDAYLKGQGVEAGIGDYARATDLVVRALVAGTDASR